MFKVIRLHSELVVHRTKKPTRKIKKKKQTKQRQEERERFFLFKKSYLNNFNYVNMHIEGIFVRKK